MKKTDKKNTVYYNKLITENFEDSLPNNERLETIIVRDLKLAYGMPLDVDLLQKLVNLRVFIVELNDLRGSDRASFPKTIYQLTKNLAPLKNL